MIELQQAIEALTAQMAMKNKINPWTVAIRLLMVCVIPWAVWISVGQVRDNDFRNKGDRWTATEAQEQEKRMIAEIKLAVSDVINTHATAPGHPVTQVRLDAIERLIVQTDSVEREETEVLRQMQKDISGYIQYMMRREGDTP